MIDTNETLLERVRRVDAHDAWREFYHAYGSTILRYGQKLGLNDHQAEEVLQETMMALMRQLPDFRYDPARGKFRNFLLTIVHRKSLGALRQAKRGQCVPFENEETGALLARSETQRVDDEVQAMEARWREVVMEDALARLAVDHTLAGGTWPVFRAYALENRSAAEVAAEFGLTENAVYQIKNRVIRRLRVDVARRLRDSGLRESGA